RRLGNLEQNAVHDGIFVLAQVRDASTPEAAFHVERERIAAQQRRCAAREEPRVDAVPAGPLAHVPFREHRSVREIPVHPKPPDSCTAYHAPMPTRADAEALLHEFTKSDALRKHGRAVEEAMRAYALWFGITDPAEIEKWGIVGLLHDFDYEQNPTEETHLHVGQRILR